jgi:hypothetical protein
MSDAEKTSEDTQADPFPNLTLEQAKVQISQMYRDIWRLEKAVWIAGRGMPMDHEEINRLLSLAR